ncbi:hypothetical protein FRC10_008528 [Ceratobasidium sp. 414]|nr:hypothetical protein FRC10_008528 [Ceratobasidium sp. 414]
MSSRESPTQSGANTPRSSGAYATLPRRSARPTPSASVHGGFEPSDTPVQCIPIRRSAEAPSYFGTHAPVVSPEQRPDGLSRSFRDMLPRSLGPETPGIRHSREQNARPSADRQWTLFGQLLEDDGAFRSRNPRRAAAGDTSSRSRAVSSVRQGIPSGATVVSGPLGRRPLSTRSGSLESTESRHTILNPPNPSASDANQFSEEPPANAELSAHEADSETDESASLTAESHKSARRPGHIRQESYGNSTDSEDEESERSQSPRQASLGSWLRLPTLSPLQKKVLKCSIAYTIGCLFTFVPALSTILTDIVPLESQQGPSPTGHMVATIIATGSFWYFELQPGWEWLADALVLSWLALAMMVIARSKLWVGKPTFGSACSMTSIILFVVIVKEGGTQVLLQVMLITVLGIIIANAACFLLWPESATTNLQKEMTTTLKSFSTLLQMLTNTFLLDPQITRKGTLLRAVEAHQKSFTSLKKVLAEARAEWCDPRIQRTAEVYEEAVLGLNRLAQHFGGLRSGTKLQFELIQSRRKARGKSREDPNGKGVEDGKKANDDPSNDEDEVLLKAAEAMFGSLVDDVGAPMKALSSSCVASLEKISTAFNSVRQPDHDPDLLNFSELKTEISRALFTFESTSDHAVMRLFRRGDGENQTIAASAEALDRENETVLLVFFFIFTLKEFARDLMALVDVMDVIYMTERRVALEEGIGGWILRHILCCIPRRRTLSRLIFSSSRIQPKRNRRSGLARRLSNLVPVEPKNRVKLFPKVKPHAPNTALRLPRKQLSRWGRIKQSFWALGQALRMPEAKYSIKTGLAVAILAAPAFIESTREMFVEYRGEWALISCFVVLSPTVGATNFLSLHRIMGTLIGATFAVTVFTLFKHQPVVLTLCSFLFSIPCFYYIVRFCFNIGWFYQCLVSSYSVHPRVLNHIASGKADGVVRLDQEDETHSPTHLSASINEFMAM